MFILVFCSNTKEKYNKWNSDILGLCYTNVKQSPRSVRHCEKMGEIWKHATQNKKVWDCVPLISEHKQLGENDKQAGQGSRFFFL